MRNHPARSWRSVLLALLLAGAFAGIAPARPTLAIFDPNVFTVNTTADAPDADPFDGQCSTTNPASAGTCTLRAAIMQANALGGAQSVRVPPGVYKLTLAGANEDLARTGDLDITGDLSVNGVRPSDPAQPFTPPVIEGNGDRVFQIGANVKAALSRLEIRNGKVIPGPMSLNGGGVLNNGELSIRNCLFANNSAVNGGAIFSAGKLTALGVIVRENHAARSGGGISAGPNTLIDRSLVSGNTATTAAGIAITGSSQLFAPIQRTTLTANIATEQGGGLDASSKVLLLNTTISGNRAPLGGGVFAQSPTAEVDLTHATIANNQANDGGGLARQGNGEQFVARNSIIANNLGGDCSQRVALSSSLHNLIGDRSCGVSAPDNNVNVNPLLSPLAVNNPNGLGTPTHALLPGSPAIDAVPDGLDNDDCLDARIDQRGVARPKGATCDMGAFEFTLPGSVGTFSFKAPPSVAADQTTTLVLAWTHPVRWSNLSAVDVQLRGEDGTPVTIRFTEGLSETGGITTTNGLALYNSDGTLAGAGEPGRPVVLESDSAALDLGQSAVRTNGPDDKTVTLTLAVRLKQPLAGKRYAATLLASDDAGELQGPEEAGTIAVGPFTTFLPLVAR